MNNLRDRLRGIVRGGVPLRSDDLEGWPPPESSTSSSLSPGGSSSSGEWSARAAGVLGGEVVERADGFVVTVDRHYGVSDRYGRTRIAEIVGTLRESSAAHDMLRRAWPTSARRPGNWSPPKSVGPGERSGLWFLDLETTGLAGGAGTQAFLVGCATLVDEGLAIRQFLLPGLEHEKALLAEMAAFASDQGAIVTFNGKSFDLPLIETRYLFHRVPFPLEDRAHVDMLHPARRLWRSRSTPMAVAGESGCSLSTLERLLAGVHRVGDVPGFEIPSRYFQFVRDGDARPLEAVLEHNRLDLISLALVMARTLTLIERGPAEATDAYECLGLARVYDRADASDEAEVAYVRAIELLERVGRDPETVADALRRLAWCRRRAGRLADAMEAWQRLAELPRCPAGLRHEAREALAIHHEHRARDLDTARTHVELMLEGSPEGRRREAAEHRLRRLERKIDRRPPVTARLW